MKSISRILSIILFLALPTACRAPTGETAAVALALSTVELESAELFPPPSLSLPASRLLPAAWTEHAIQEELVETEEQLVRSGAHLPVIRAESPSWTVDKDVARGRLVVRSRLPAGPPAAGARDRARSDSVRRLSRWGVPLDEIAVTENTSVMAQSEDLDVIQAPELHSYKTFVYRGLGDVRIEGHRAVLTHGPDGSFRRAYIRWPPLAASGHRLQTRLGKEEIRAAVARALAEEGVPAAPARLRWKLVPTTLASGEVALTLKAAARVTIGGEQREVDVDVLAE